MSWNSLLGVWLIGGFVVWLIGAGRLGQYLEIFKGTPVSYGAGSAATSGTLSGFTSGVGSAAGKAAGNAVSSAIGGIGSGGDFSFQGGGGFVQLGPNDWAGGGNPGTVASGDPLSTGTPLAEGL